MRLLNSANLGSIRTKNRLIRAAVLERAADEDGNITPAYLAIHEELARKGAGLIISGYFYISSLGKSSHFQAGIENDERSFQLKALTAVTHRHGCPIIAQICHGGRQTNPKLLAGAQPVAPSPLTDKSTGVTPRELSGLQIEGIIDDFYRAAMRAKGSGFDGVELHAAHGYLLSQFLSPYTNRRQDEYGGNLVNRARVIQTIIRRIKERYGDDFTVLVKMNSDDYLSGGNKLKESVEIARLISAAGADGLEISGGMWESGDKIIRKGIKTPKQEGYFQNEARQIKRSVGCPVILVGGLRTTEVMEDLIAKGYADFVSLARPFIREPDLVAKFKEGKQKADCISCNGCMSPRAMPTHCTRIGMPTYLKKALAKKTSSRKSSDATARTSKPKAEKKPTSRKPGSKSTKKPKKTAAKRKPGTKRAVKKTGSSLKKKLLKIKKRILR
jgi:2,4-dienoyl-CoA reductase-like NADH-dependent reductase (Old Yellow Enzyme family)